MLSLVLVLHVHHYNSDVMFIGAPTPTTLTLGFILFVAALLYAKTYKGFNPFGIYTNERLRFILLMCLFAFIAYKAVMMSA